MKKIGCGSEGSVYKFTHKNKIYALKISHQENKNKTFSSSYWREIFFANKMHKKYPKYFMKLHHYNISKNDGTNYTMIDINDISPIKFRNYYKNLINNGYISKFVYDYVEYTLDKLLRKKKTFKKNNILSVIIQISYVAYLLRKNNFINIDMGPKNIGLNKTKQKYLEIFGKKIPTFGYQVILIDYGKILHKKYILTQDELNMIKLNETMIFDTYSIKYIMDVKKSLFIEQEQCEFILNNINKPKIIINYCYELLN